MLSSSATIFSDERLCKHCFGRDEEPTPPIGLANGGLCATTSAVPVRVTKLPSLKKKVVPRRLPIFSAPHIHDCPLTFRFGSGTSGFDPALTATHPHTYRQADFPQGCGACGRVRSRSE